MKSNIKIIRNVFFAIICAAAVAASAFAFSTAGTKAGAEGSAIPTAFWQDDTTVTFLWGGGTETSPFRISTPEDMAYLIRSCGGIGMTRNYYGGKYFLLTQSIDMSAKRFTPIGSGGGSFEGKFDGNFHTITGVYIDSPTADNIGIFAAVYGSGEIKNLGRDTAVSGYVRGRNNVGGIAGELSDSAVIENCTFSGIVEGVNYVGGIAGFAGSGTAVKKCFNSAAVSANFNVGGVAGLNSGRISESANCGNITAAGTIGGVVGYAEGSGNDGIVSSCFNSGTICLIGTPDNTTAYGGGIAGFSEGGKIYDCYNLGEVRSESEEGSVWIAGIIGRNEGAVQNCYVAAYIQDNGQSAVICASIDSIVQNSYYHTGFNGAMKALREGSSEYFDSPADGALGLSYSAMSGNSPFGAGKLDFQNIAGRPAVSETWVSVYSYPQLLNNSEFVLGSPLIDSGSAAKPFGINTSRHIMQFSARINNGHSGLNLGFRLAASFTLPKNTPGLFSNFEPAGFYSSSPAAARPFEGTFDGYSLSISGIRLSRRSVYQGLFGYNRGIIKNLTLNDGEADATYSGAFVGYNQGEITGCTNRLTVTGDTAAGGIAAYSAAGTGLIRNCRNYGAVTAYDANSFAGGIAGNSAQPVSLSANFGQISGKGFAGGIAGNCHDTIDSSFNAGIISGADKAGGIAGFTSGAIRNCYNTGSVAGSGKNSTADGAGGIAGAVNAAALTNCYNWSDTSNGNGRKGSIAGTNSAGTFTDCVYNGDGSAPGAVNNAAAAGTYSKSAAAMSGLDSLSAAKLNFKNVASPVINVADVWAAAVGRPPVLKGNLELDIRLETDYLNYGSETNPVFIRNYDQLSHFSYNVSIGLDGGEGTYYMQDASITFPDGYAFTPIGSVTRRFAGTYDGNFYTISNLHISLPDTDNVGLFGYVAASGCLRKIILDNSSVTGKMQVGGFAGSVSGRIENCRNVAVISGQNAIGGIVGLLNNRGIIYNCFNMGAVTGVSYTGGVVGLCYSSTYIIGCRNSGPVKGSALTGGIVGLGGGITLYSSYNCGAVSGSTSFIGGLAGEILDSDVQDCYNSGSVAGKNKYIGAIAGNVINTSFSNVYYDRQTLSGFTLPAGYFRPGFAIGEDSEGGAGSPAPGSNPAGCLGLDTLMMTGPNAVANMGFAARPEYPEIVWKAGRAAFTHSVDQDFLYAFYPLIGSFENRVSTPKMLGTAAFTAGSHTYGDTDTFRLTAPGYPLSSFTFSYKFYGDGDDKYTSVKPVDAGFYAVKLTAPATETYRHYEGVLTYTINKKNISNDYEIKDIEKTLIYNGSQQRPTPVIKGLTIADYSVAYENNINAGTAEMTVTGIGNYTGVLKKTFFINSRVFSGELNDILQTFTYTGSEIKPAAVVPDYTEGADYTVSYCDNIAAGTAMIRIQGRNNCSGLITQTFTILPKVLTASMANNIAGTFTYDDGPYTPAVTMTGLTENVDFYVEYSSNIDAGTALATITGKGNYTGILYKTFAIGKKMITSEMVNEPGAYYTYTGSPFTPIPVVDGLVTGVPLVYGKDFTVSYIDNIDAHGSAPTVAVIGIGNFTGLQYAHFVITPKALVPGMMQDITEEFSYTGDSVTPTPVIAGLISGRDYSYYYENNGVPGMASVVITGVKNYSGSFTKYFTIVPKKLTDELRAVAQDYTYTGSAITPAPSVTGGLGANDYTAGYYDNTAAGTATLYITGKGNYSGTLSRTFRILPKAMTASMVSGDYSREYNGAPYTPDIALPGLTVNVDYTVSYSNNIDAGTALAAITGKGNYTGVIYKAFIVARQEIASGAVDFPDGGFTYTGSPVAPVPAVGSLIAGRDYIVRYSDNVNAGTASATVTGIGNYRGTITKNFVIAKAAQSAFSAGRPDVRTLGSGGFYLVAAGGNGSGAVTYEVTGGDAAEVASDGLVTLKKAGAVTIKAVKAADSNYLAASDTITITVLEKQAEQVGGGDTGASGDAAALGVAIAGVAVAAAAACAAIIALVLSIKKKKSV